MIADAEPIPTIGWDVGGAHVKACLVAGGQVVDVAQWPCPLWQGLDHLARAIDAARARWPAEFGAAQTRHAATMTGEMVDLFPDRATGVRRIAALMAEALGPGLMLFAGGALAHEAHVDIALDGSGAAAVDVLWRAPHEAGTAWRELASANWRATALWVARRLPEALLVDIGSTTTDIVAVRDGDFCGSARDDAARLADGSLVYHGVVRTPLCALAPRVAFGGHDVNVMNEFFATTADVYRVTGELDPTHDQLPTADGAGKDLPATQQRLARMIGRDAADADDAAWLSLAHGWRRVQSHEIAGQMERVIALHGLGAQAPVVSAGCGAFLAEALARATRHSVMRFADLLPAGSDELRGWAQVAAPAVAVALLLDSAPPTVANPASAP